MKHFRSMFTGLLALCLLALLFASPASAYPSAAGFKHSVFSEHGSAFDVLALQAVLVESPSVSVMASAAMPSRRAVSGTGPLAPIYLLSHQTDGVAFRELHRRC